ncbi:tyrosine recombinase XerD [mine drainage metagenome]|uniref:Tyrosine recombinase XerD n=1 Tax=mine drainage metagenome TaxID=410659 RepID=A0A1J5QAA5_9ZZZZ
MTGRAAQLAAARQLAVAPYDRVGVLAHLGAEVAGYRFRHRSQGQRMLRATGFTLDALDRLPGERLADRWEAFEAQVWPRWLTGDGRPPVHDTWTWGMWALVTSRLVRPSWPFLTWTRTTQWVARLPLDDPMTSAHAQLVTATAALPFGTPMFAVNAVNRGLRALLHCGVDELSGLTEADLRAAGRGKGADVLDAALCQLGVFTRTPQRGTLRWRSVGRREPADLAGVAGVPEPFRQVAGLYLEHYSRRLSDNYATLQHKARALAHFFTYLQATHPQVTSCAQITPAHARGFVGHAVEQARTVQRGRHKGSGDTTSAHAWLVDVRCFFADLCTWATEADSPFVAHCPSVVPLTRHDLLDSGFADARKRTEARLTRTVLDLEREIPNIRAFALRRWHETQQALRIDESGEGLQRAERIAFWDWALLELLLTSGLRIEEACELTTFDILKRALPDGRLYYLLHVKPSKFDRARVIPIGDQLGRVIAEIIRHVRGFYGSDHVPACDRRDEHEKRALACAPYLLQGRTHPSTLNSQTIRGRLSALSLAAGATHSDGRPLALTPHDCRRVFASEHLNSNTPVHVIQALLGHATVNTVMIYAKLYPTQLVEEYRRAMRGLYGDVYGPEASRAPTDQEWAVFTANCSMRDMGTHMCALPTGEHCPRGLVCLGCGHAQPKKSATPIFRRMLLSHTRALERARETGEPAGQLAARELEVERISSALQRAQELTADAAAALEAAAV